MTRWFHDLISRLLSASHPIVTCSTRKEHAGRLNFVLAPSEAKLSAINGFRHYSALDLTSEVTGWPRTLSLYINLFVSRRAARSFFPRSSSSIRGETARGVVPPLCRGKMRNGLCRRGLIPRRFHIKSRVTSRAWRATFGMESAGYYDLPKFGILGILDALIFKTISHKLGFFVPY